MTESRYKPQVFYLKGRDTRPTMIVTLYDPDRTVHDLSGATSAHLHVYLADTGDVLTRDMEIDADPTTGIVRYTWLATDWTSTPAIVAGSHNMEVEVIGSGTARLTFPNYAYDLLVVTADIGQA